MSTEHGQSAENDTPLGDWFRRTPESLRMLAEETEALRSAEKDAPKCAHAHVESWRKFGGTLLWRCLDCGADSRDDTTVIPPERTDR